VTGSKVPLQLGLLCCGWSAQSPRNRGPPAAGWPPRQARSAKVGPGVVW